MGCTGCSEYTSEDEEVEMEKREKEGGGSVGR